MAIVPFTYYLHDEDTAYERADDIGSQIGIDLDEAMIEKMGNPFYEVGLNCTLDTETGEVKIVGVI